MALFFRMPTLMAISVSSIGVDVRIPSRENRFLKDDLDKVACRPCFWFGLRARLYRPISLEELKSAILLEDGNSRICKGL